MYKKGVSLSELESVRTEVPQSKRRDSTPEGTYEKRLREKKTRSKRSDFVYVNDAYVGSLDSVNESGLPTSPPTSVIREQYWTCSRWPMTQRILAISVGILLGAVIGLAVGLVLKQATGEVDIGGFLKFTAPDIESNDKRLI